MSEALPYSAIWVLDFEFIARNGEHPEVVCLVAHEVISHRWIRIWQGDFSSPPFSLDDDTLLLGYSDAAEWSCFLALGWPMPARCLDLYAEFICHHNGLADSKLFPSLIAAAAHYGIPTMDADHKGDMRELILSGGPWTSEQQHAILDYCQADVRITAELFKAMKPTLQANRRNLGGALLRGRYTAAVARMEHHGIPLDFPTLNRLRAGWDAIKLDLIVDIDRDYGVYEGTTFVASRFEVWVMEQGIPWPRSPCGRLELSDEDFRKQAKAYPRVQGRQPHRPHQSLHLLAADDIPEILQPVPEAARSIEWSLQVAFIDRPHQSQITLCCGLGPVVKARSWQIQQSTLPQHRQRIRPVHHGFLLGP